MKFFKQRSETMPALGKLEVAVLQCLWAAPGELDAQALHDELAERKITLSTVQATVERLHRKGLVERVKVSRAYRYRAAVTRGRLIGALIHDLSRQLAAGELDPVVSGFMDLADANPELLDKLEAQASKRRKERG